MKFKTILFGFLTWFIPVAVSMFMYDQETGNYLPNMAVFKSVMVGMLFLLTYLFYRNIARFESANWVQVATVFLIICAVFDFAVLLTVFKVEFTIWLAFILPFYLLSFYGFGYFYLRKTTHSTS